MKKNQFHCCATCKHFRAVKEDSKISYFCSRLGYETKPDYVFNCWDPKERVKSLMKKRERDKQ
ncbi:hypothetical protein [Ectobacillus panaciterrae]|uniref:hypothetical protein n=1 Tax=Ectobacillus panaciterrae TaxID=363872 RepID=UPI0004270E85|nr:hypothetical protein [Ectobacillus panaciterrae]